MLIAIAQVFMEISEMKTALLAATALLTLSMATHANDKLPDTITGTWWPAPGLDDTRLS
jgi:hypothetical protein